MAAPIGSHCLTTNRILATTFPQVKCHDQFTFRMETFYSPYTREKALGGAFSGVVATCSKTGTGYRPFPQVRAFTPHTGGIYSPLLATTLVATFWLPTGYHPEQGFRGLFSDVAAWVKTRWTWKRGLEMLELLSGSDGRHYSPTVF